MHENWTDIRDSLPLWGRSLAAAMTGMTLMLAMAPLAIRWLRAHFRERIVSDSAMLNRLHAEKRDTPTMGGVFIMLAVLIATMIWTSPASPPVAIGLLAMVYSTCLGSYDDWVKARFQRQGLMARTKLVFQLIGGFACGAAIYSQVGGEVLPSSHNVHELIIPIVQWRLPLGIGLIAWTALVLTASSNGMNLTDGLDGLAAGCSVIISGAMTIVCVGLETAIHQTAHAGRQGAASSEFAVLTAALGGAMLGFLWFNRHPARVFMGDAGALAAGTVLGLSAVISGREISFVVIAGVLVIETLSVIVQVTWFKRTGRRILLCSPIHHHFVFQGTGEAKIVAYFWLTCLTMAIAGVFLV